MQIDMKTANYLVVLVVLSFLIYGCDTTDSNDDNYELNPKLYPVFYWGYSGPGVKVPNTGQSVGPPILNAAWTHHDLITFTTSFLDENDAVRKGVFEININPDTYSLVNNEYHIYEYEPDIQDMNYIPASGDYLMLVSDNGTLRAVRAALAGDNVVEKEILVDDEWSIEGITIWYGKDGFIFYGINPETGISGFYSLIWNSSSGYAKELIYSIEDPGLNTLSFITSMDGNYLYFGLNGSTDIGNMQLLRLTLNGENKQAEVVLERNGSFIYAAQNPINQSLFLINYYFGGDAYDDPKGHIELYNSLTSESIDLDVRTISSKYYMIINEHPGWSPDGNNFVFSAGGFSGEGDTYMPDLWIYENVP